jgi:hypothetical protein
MTEINQEAKQLRKAANVTLPDLSPYDFTAV